ncbi:MAG: efflux RND transporter periplasmic adaptor subunit [Bacillota bacterium]|nr:MAG: efflux RND transporter periplasmic adaptor subunit [Bacillota bacterium]
MSRPRTILIIVVAAVVFGAAVFGFRAVRVGSWRARSGATSYSTAAAARGTLEVAVTGTGTLAAGTRQVCLSGSGGKVASVEVEPGQTVQAGQVLVVLVNESLSDQVEQARIELRLAQMDLEAMTQPGPGLATDAAVASAEAAVETARVAVDRARRNVEDLTVEAPFAGRVFGLDTRAGDEVPPGTTLLTAATTEELKAVLSVPEWELEHLSPGGEVTVTVTALGENLRGHVSAIAPQGTANSRGDIYYQVTVVLDESDPRARGGMSVAAAIKTGDPWPFDTTTVHGLLAYVRIQPVVATTGGTVTAVHTGEGEAVTEGQLLLILENQEAVAALAQAEADLDRALERLAQLTGGETTSYAAADIERQTLRVKAAGLRLAGLERQLSDLTVRAAFAGVVTDVAVSAGEEVTPGKPVAVVADLTTIQAVVTVDELEVANLSPGQTATVRVDALPGETFTGTLDSLSLEGVVRDGVTSYEARVSLPGDARMKVGMSCSASIQVARRENALLVPVEAVYGAGAEATVQVLVDGKPQARPVVAGLSNGTFTEILDGLEEGTTVITGSLQVDNNPFGSGQQPGSQPGSGGGG